MGPKSKKVPNLHDVPKRLWSQFGPVGRRVYNEVMAQSVQQDLVKHPGTAKLPDEQWHTIRHNMAFFAAFAAKEVAAEIARNIA